MRVSVVMQTALQGQIGRKWWALRRGRKASKLRVLNGLAMEITIYAFGEPRGHGFSRAIRGFKFAGFYSLR